MSSHGMGPGLDMSALAACVALAYWLLRGHGWGEAFEALMRWALGVLAFGGAVGAAYAYYRIGRALTLAVIGGEP